MGLLDFLGPGLTAATNAAGTYQHAEAQAAQQKTQQAIQNLMLQRQLEQMRIENALKQAQTGEATAKAQTYTPQYAGQVAGAQAQAQWPYKEQELRAKLDNDLTMERARGATEQQIAALRIQGERGIEQMRIQNAVGLQQNQQQFLSGQNAANRAAAAQRTQAEVQGHLKGIQQTQSGQILPTIENWFGVGPLANQSPAPSVGNAPPAAPKVKIHTTEYQALKAAGYPEDEIQATYEVAP